MEQVSDFMPNECGRRADDRVDRISQLPDEIIFVILSFLRYKEAATTTVLSSRWLDLWKHIPDLKFDTISRLPNQIIAVILSFLRLKEAAATTVLSSRWLDLWKHTPNLEFDRYILPCYDGLWDAHRCKYIEIVNSVIQSHKALSLKTFRLDVPGNRIAKCAVTKWLEFVFSRQVESLCLNFNAMDNLVLEELLRESRICLQPQTELIFFQSLKRLILGFLTVSGDDIKLVLRDCPLLEHLMIEWATLTSDVEVCGEKLVLKRLVIFDCKGQKSIKVSAPNLTYIWFRDDGGKVLFESVPKLVEANFDIFFEPLQEQPACMHVMTDVRRSPHQHLKVFELLRRNESGDLVELVMYILNNCVALRKIIIGRMSSHEDVANRYRDSLTQRLQGKVPNHVQLIFV